MYIGRKYTFRWVDIEDCTILLSRDGGENYDETIAENVITEEVGEEINGSYEWTVTEPVAESCFVKFIDNSDDTELIGEEFEIKENTRTTAIISYIIRKQFNMCSMEV